MRIRRVHHGQIVWRQRLIAGVPNSPVAVRVSVKRHKPIVWTRKALAGTSSGGVSEAATLADSVSAIFAGNVNTAESVTLSDLDTYPVNLFAQTINRGRNPPIIWRQRESVATGTSYAGDFTDQLTPVDVPSASQAFAAVSILETISAIDADGVIGGATQVSVVEAETIAETVGTAWAFNSLQAEGLNAVDAADSVGGSPVRNSGGAGDYEKRKRKFVTRVGDRLVSFDDPNALEMLHPPELDVSIELIEAKAKTLNQDKEVAALLKAEKYTEVLQVYEDWRDEEDIEMLLLAL